jgi:hypothetical protein
MAKTNTTSLSYSVSGESFLGTPMFAQVFTNTSGLPPGSFTLAAGFNSIPVPATALGVTIVPPPGSTNTKTLKGVTGDTGIGVDPASPIVLKFTAAQIANIGITSGGVETLTLLWG